MKKFTLILFFVFLAANCGKDPVPTPGPGPAPTPIPGPGPGPVPVPVETMFEVNGLKIAIKGQMKPGVKTPMSEMRAVVRAAVAQLESARLSDVEVK